MNCPCCGQHVDKVDPVALVESIPLSTAQRRVARVLAGSFGRWVETAELVAQAYRDDPSGGPLSAANVVSIQVMKLRRALLPYGIAIESEGGRGNTGRRMAYAGAAP